MLSGPCEGARIARDCQLKKMVVVRPLVPKGLFLPDLKFLHFEGSNFENLVCVCNDL